MPPKSKNVVIRRPTPQAREVYRDEAGETRLGEPLFYQHFESPKGLQKRVLTASQVAERGLDGDVLPASKGQGSTTATSARTGWEYEHDETDKQIDAIEELIESIRAESGATNENKGIGDDGGCLRGATFSWSSSTDDGEGDITISTMYTEPGDGVVQHRGVQLENTVWVSESWVIHPNGKVEAA